MSKLSLNQLEAIAERALTWIRVGIVIGILALCVIYAARGAEPAVEAMRPAPRAFFAVMQCDELVAGWLVTQDGKVFRTDAMNHPDTPTEYGAFLAWAQTAQSLDIYTIPCSDKAAGGKPRAKQTT
jgi:hypothetical protein